MREYKTIDIFCSCGLMSLGFQSADFNIIKVFNNWNLAVEVYNNHFTGRAELFDICDLSSEYLKSFSPEVIIGGPPCQDYSSFGKQDETLGQASLTFRYAELVCAVCPEWFVMENVDRIIRSCTLSKTLTLFKSYGYGLPQVILDASLC